MIQHRAKITGIYQIKNTTTGECYVGSSVNIQERLYNHMCNLCKGVHINKLLQESWNRDGPVAFTFSILEAVENRTVLRQREVYWVKKTEALEKGFNTQTDLFKRSTVVVVGMETKKRLENLEMGSMNSTMSQLLKYYRKSGGSAA